MLRFALPVTAFALLLAPLAADARYQIRSDFRLHLTEPVFDSLIGDFWQSLQGAQSFNLGNRPVNLGDTQLNINGINLSLNYSFALPKRVDPTHREWLLESQSIAASVTVDQLLATQHKVVNVGGVTFVTDVTIECRNLSVTLPAGLASISARIRAEIAQNQIQLSMPDYHANWPANAWVVKNLDCPELGNLEGVIQQQIVSYLANLDNVNAAVASALNDQFAGWSKNASLLLLSEQELPTTSDHLKVHFEPRTATENAGNGLVLGGVLRFEYPYVSQAQDIDQEFHLPDSYQFQTQSKPQLVIPFPAVRALMMGQYFAGKLEYTMRSAEIPAFQTLMGSWFQKVYAWPDLNNFASNTTFLFQFLPMGPPSFENEQAGAAGVINGDMTMPLAIRMFAPKGGKYVPYVEFRSNMSGPASMQLGAGGKIHFQITASDQPATYAFAQKYVEQYNPSTRIAIKTISTAARDSLSTDGMDLAIPPFTVGKQLQLNPGSWALESGGVLKLDFTVDSSVTAPVASVAVKTANGKTLNVTSTKKKK